MKMLFCRSSRVAPLRCATAFGNKEELFRLLTQRLSLSAQRAPRERTGLTYVAPTALGIRKSQTLVSPGCICGRGHEGTHRGENGSCKGW